MRLQQSVARSTIASRLGMILPLFLLLSTVVGCQAYQPDLGERLMAHVARVNCTGLAPATDMSDLNARAAIPQGWDMMDADSSALYYHEQWRSPTRSTGVGVAWIHMPLPMSAKAVVWFAKGQYSKMKARQHKADADTLDEWTDSLGREWFEGENEKYHVKGYVVTSGFSAWAVYTGYRLKFPPNAADINLAYRSMDSVVPLPLAEEQANSSK